MSNRLRVGVLTPSSNTALEPITQAIVANIPNCTAHFSRFEVQEISLRPEALAQFDLSTILAAARLLAHARVDAICWSGTAAGWTGFASDVKLCEAIQAETGIPATSAVLAMNELLLAHGVTRLGLVTPYIKAVQDRIISNYREHGIECVAESHLDISVNFEFGMVPPVRLKTLIEDVALSRPQAIAVYCTNLAAAPLAAELEKKHDVLMVDSVAAAAWGVLRAAGADTRCIRNWGRMFASAPQV